MAIELRYGTCETCGATTVAGQRGPIPRWCKPSHKPRKRYINPNAAPTDAPDTACALPTCSNMFHKVRNQLYCSPECAAAAHTNNRVRYSVQRRMCAGNDLTGCNAVAKPGNDFCSVDCWETVYGAQADPTLPTCQRKGCQRTVSLAQGATGTTYLRKPWKFCSRTCRILHYADIMGIAHDDPNIAAQIAAVRSKAAKGNRSKKVSPHAAVIEKIEQENINRDFWQWPITCINALVFGSPKHPTPADAIKALGDDPLHQVMIGKYAKHLLEQWPDSLDDGYWVKPGSRMWNRWYDEHERLCDWGQGKIPTLEKVERYAALYAASQGQQR